MAQADTPKPLNRSSEASPSHLAWAPVALPQADERATAAAIDGLGLSHLLRVRLMHDKDARAHTTRAFEALVKNPPLKGVA